MSNKIAFIFPGQGAQYPGMGKSLYEKYPEARNIFDKANGVLGFDLKYTIFNGTDEELKQTSVTQAAIFTVSCAALNALRAVCPDLQASFAAGHSLGEYSALYAAGAYDFETGLNLVKQRGQFIQDASMKSQGSMAAILNVPRQDLQKLCAESAQAGGVCEMVNFNSPGQIVAAGTKPAIEALAKKIGGITGAKAIILNVSGAFHSTLMKEAAAKMSGVLENALINDIKLPVITNCDAETTTYGNDIKKKLVSQIDHPVLWEDAIRRMISNGAEFFIEIGPGKVLSGLLRKIDRKIISCNIEDEESLNKLAAEFNLVGK